ncbi:DNA segregation ATPase FtsK/SpoIIIE, S-DNA-T family [Streptomyces sp. cf386]|uniref:FtsK/SpoIIIE domain-containing protein n=1 Tax=Streptomyces sp. cf386 TaxID=1761904 RepID=UPI000887C136|nr:FtsK/SpoIIIE domain-containing protein [Streptomyces sp. cf386]SDM63138.1 DNA segregation ATPase FtsK/SpoIIIE, S-DNA-T family [Streptomyces sp. cf386]
MPASLVVWILSALLLVGVLTQKWWEPRLEARGVRPRQWPVRWWLLGYPSTALRILSTWRRLAYLNGLSVSLSPTSRVIGRDLVVQGQALKPKPPRLSLPVPTATGLRLRVLLHPGQTPGPYFAAARAMEHAWRVHRVWVTSPRRGLVVIHVTAVDPLAGPGPFARPPAPVLLSADVGRSEDGEPWLIDLRRVPHWLVTGATQSGKSSLLAALVLGLAPQRVALVGVDCKGGMELGLFAGRLSALAINRTEAVGLLARVVDEITHRMGHCRSWGKRSVWELPEEQRPVPVVVIVDELAELYLTDGSRESKDQAEQCGTLLLRIAQLGAALGVHLVIAGQRVGSDLGPRVTALRAQLGGRVAHRVHDEASAEMTLGDINADAVVTAQAITEDEQGVAVVAMGGRWLRARSHQVSTADAAAIGRTDPPVNPFMTMPDPVTFEKGEVAA